MPQDLVGQRHPVTGRPFISGGDGSWATEESITVTHPLLNQGQPTNIPSIWGGQRPPFPSESPEFEDWAVDQALKSGQPFRSFNSIDEAVQAARERSNQLGREMQPILTDPQPSWTPRFEPVDHDPFAARPMAFMPVDNDPFMTSPEDAFAYGKGISPDATWRNLLPAAELGLSMAPGSGEAMSARDAWDASGRAGAALTEGNLGEAASEYLNMGTGLLGAIPGAGIVARGTKRGAAWMDQNLPEGFNRLLDAVYPSDPGSTTFSGAGPSAKRRISGSSDSPERPRKTTEHLVYHGTPTELTGGKFDPDRIRSHGGGFYFSDNPAVAEFYSKQPNISSGKSSPQVIPAYVDTEGFLVKDYGGRSYKEMVRDAAEIKASGKYKGIIGKNVRDAAQVDGVGITYIPQTQYLTWTPNTVRSSKTNNQLYNLAPYAAAPALGYGLYGARDDDQ